MAKINVARDLFLLSAVAFRNGKYDQAGELFSAALSSDDSSEFLNVVQILDLEKSQAEQKKIATTRSTISDIAASISKAMGDSPYQVVAGDNGDDDKSDNAGGEGGDLASSKTDDETLQQDQDQESESFDVGVYGNAIVPNEEIYGDEQDPDTPGQRMILPVLSSVVPSPIGIRGEPMNKWKVSITKQ